MTDKEKLNLISILIADGVEYTPTNGQGEYYGAVLSSIASVIEFESDNS